MNDDAGMVRPFRRRVRHPACGTLTVISGPAAEALALDPRSLSAIRCTSCQQQFPAGDFAWIGDDGNDAEPVGWMPPAEPEAEDDDMPSAEPEQPQAAPVPVPDLYVLTEDAEDRRAALAAATALLAGAHPAEVRGDVIIVADHAYRWLRARDTLRPAAIQIIAGTPYNEGSSPVTATINLDDTAQVDFSLGGTDAKGAEVGAPSDTWTWTLTDPDSSGASVTPSADTTSATVAAGTPTANLLLSVAGQNSGLQGAEAIIVQATAATTISLTAGTPTAETPAAPPADGSATPSA